MNIAVWRLCVGGIRRWLLMICVGISVIILFQSVALPSWKQWSSPHNATFSASVFQVDNEVNSSGLEDQIELEMDREELTSKTGYSTTGDNNSIHNGVVGELENEPLVHPLPSPTISMKDRKRMDIGSTTKLVVNITQSLQLQHENTKLRRNYTRDNFVFFKNLSEQSISVAQMNLLLLQSRVSPRSRSSSARDRQLLSAKLSILNAPIVKDIPPLHPSVFRNVSLFKRSYELMERTLKVYVYKEGKKPIFHQPAMRGIYASEGWFMKLMEGNKKFAARDPRKAHLFYLPFSSRMLRYTLPKEHLEEHLRKYVDLISRKYNFWNRTGGEDHFLVGCHDWASKLTKRYMKNCIRALCNANVAKDFRIGKDTSLPVTYVRSMETPLENVGGNPPLDRHILAFFAGGMHGYVRPILLQYWENKEPDMKIFGPLPRDLKGKGIYREYMKSSKYCICARGYEVHTPRVVEAIFYECVPVIISDNYVPPFFEVLNWEAFSVFVQEKDIPNLRNILLSIPKEKYISLQVGVKMVQEHFFWHKKPVKYDLFHMILHSVWYNRVFQIESR